MSLTIRITAESDSTRADAFLTSALAIMGVDLSRSYIKKLFEDGAVTIKGKPVKPGLRPNPGDVFEVVVPEPAVSDIAPQDIPLDIVFEDSHLIVVNKLQGMVVHPAPGHFSGTLVNALLYHCGADLSGINGVFRPGIVHRIDKDTSGLLVAAKNDASHRSLAEQLAERKTERLYSAVTMGRIDEPFTIDAAIGRHRVHRKKMCADATGRAATTHITPVQVYTKPAVLSHITARLETGRTHQIRVHLAHVNRPVLGDIVYGPEKQPFKLNGQMLHAQTLGFVHPESGEFMRFTAPLPRHFQAVLDNLTI